jgi:membrane associated rhomboid family serine protease
MALADRFYMRDSYHPPRATTILIWALIAAYIAQCVLIYYADIPVMHELGLTASGLREGKVWQLFTFQFLHSFPWPWHVLFNCLGLYFFGRPVEEVFGSKKFLALYLLCGTVGGLVQALTMLLPRHFDVPTVGASAGVCGMIAIFCMLQPMQQLTYFVYFFPVSLRARTLLIILTCVSLFGVLIPIADFSLFGSRGTTIMAYGAHFGGILTGVAFVRWGSRVSEWLQKLQVPRRRKDKPRGLARSQPWRARAERREQVVAADEFMSKKVDPILDKIAAQGIHSLTDAERKILEAARKKMDKR